MSSAGPAASAGAIGGRVQNVVTGQYLNNARITVLGTDLIAFTDQTGRYRLAPVPAGLVTIEVFYTGLDPQRIPLQVVSGQTTERDIDLSSVSRYGQETDTVRLDSFVVASSRETDGESIAINEQRFAPNIKNVMAADALGDVMDGNVGEFLKFLPGIVAEYDTESGGAVAAVSIRGLASNLTVVSSDGAPMANTSNPMGQTRSFQFGQVSMNNVSRIEVTKVPTPSTPADSLSGSINMISKSSFERRNRQLRYSLSLSANHYHPDFHPTLHTTDEKIYKIRPSVSFDYTLPVNRDFGLVITGLSMNRYVNQFQSRKVYNGAGTATGASLAQPFLQTYRWLSAPRLNSRNSIGLRADWRVTSNAVLTVAVQASHFVSDRDPVELLINTGTNANPTPASGERMTYGENYTIGATGRGAVSMIGAAVVDQRLGTLAGNARYRFDDGRWRFDLGAHQSLSKGGYRDTSEGHFRQFGIAMMNPVRVSFREIDAYAPRVIEVYNNANQPVDIHDINNYRLNTATTTPRDIRDELRGGDVNLRRQFDVFTIPVALQIGGLHRIQERDVRRQSIVRTYNGLDGNPATPESPAPFVNTRFVNRGDQKGFPSLPWVSPTKAWQAFKRDPSLFSQTSAQSVNEETYRINNSEYLKEAVSALYWQAELRFWQNRLWLITGIRYEKTQDDGLGPLSDPGAAFLRNADGSFVRDADNNRVRRPEAGAPGSLDEIRLTLQERAFQAKRAYDGYYPSLHLNYQIRENFLARFAYAKTYGRPDFTEIIPNAVIDEADIDDEVVDPTALPGRINIRNTGLRPWSADNYDFSLEYYTAQGGLFSAGVFLKEIRDFFGTFVKLATAEDLQELNLDPRYLGWQLTTKFNSGDARISGAEFNIKHSLRGLGVWGHPWIVFVNGTKLQLEGHELADFRSFTKESLNWGATYSRKPVTIMAKWNHRGKRQRTAVPAVNGFEYDQARTMLDVNIDWQLKNNLFFYLTVQNVFNKPEVFQRYGPDTPEYAKRYLVIKHGAQLAVGIKGSF